MTEIQSNKRYDLEDRTLVFAKEIRIFVLKFPKTTVVIEDGKQVIRSSGSIGANYIEANESLSRKDFVMRIKISRKEAKETAYWLQLFELSSQGNGSLEKERERLLQEVTELQKIFGAILEKSK